MKKILYRFSSQGSLYPDLCVGPGLAVLRSNYIQAPLADRRRVLGYTQGSGRDSPENSDMLNKINND